MEGAIAPQAPLWPRHWIVYILKLLRGIAYLLIFQAAKFASGSSEWFPYQVRSNLIRNTDHNRLHLDVNHEKEKEWTFLLYLTPNWTRNYYGETIYFERNSDDTDVIAVVRPRYGRAVIFQGNVSTTARKSGSVLSTYGPFPLLSQFGNRMRSFFQIRIRTFRIRMRKFVLRV